MSNTNIENQLRLANAELNSRIALLEKTSLEKESVEKALQDSEKRYRRLFESAKDGILILDADTGMVVDVNPFLLKLLGYSYDELYGQYIWELGVFKDIAASREAFKTLQDNEYIRYEDLPMETHDGRPIAVEFVSNVYLVDYSKVIQCNIRDITERREIENGLEKARKELAATKISEDEAHEYAESMINTVREPLIVLDHDLRVVTASRSFYEFFKVKLEETVGKLIYDLGNKQWDIPKLRELLESILPQKTTFDDYEVEHDFAGIGRRIMLLNARQIKRVWGKERIILLSIEDVTERRQLEILLEDSEKHYRRLFETANDGILLLEKREGNIGQANPAIMAMLGYSEEEFIGNDLKGVGFPDDVGTIQEILQTLEMDDIIHYKDTPVKKKTGQVIYTDIYMVDKASLVQCNIRDITERKHAEEAARAFLDSVINTIADPVFVKDDQRRFVLVNEALCAIVGRPREALLGEDGDDMFPKEEVAVFRKMDATVLETGYENVNEESLSNLSSGEVRTIVTRKTRYIDPAGKKFLVGVIRDITERKQAEEVLRKNEERYRTILDNIEHGYYEVDIQGKFTFFNDSLCNLLGYSRSEMIGMNSRQYTEQQVGKKLYQAFNEVYRTGKVIKGYAWEIIKKDGSKRFLESTISLMKNISGHPTGFNGIVRDITERKLADEALRESEKKYRWLLDNMADVITIMDMNLRFTYVSPSIMRMRGYTAEEATAQTFEQVMTPESLAISARVFEEEMKLEASGTADPGRTRILELAQYRKDGSIVWMENSLSYMRDEAKKAVGIISVSRDITDRKRIEEALKESENRYRIIAENMADIITIFDMNLRITYVSPSIKKLRGFTAEEAITQTLEQIITPDSLKLVSKVFEEELQLEATGTADPFRTRVLELEEYKKDGSITWVENRLSFLRDTDQKPMGILSVSRDIAERRRAEAEIHTLSTHQQALLSAIPDIIMEVDVNKVYTWANPAGFEFFGDDVIGKQADYYFEGEQKTYEITQPLFNGGEDVIYLKSWQRRKDSKKRLLAWCCKVLKDKNGNATGALSSARDITDQQTLEAQLQQAQKMESVGRLAGGVAHDFNNMLSVILGHAEMALEQVDSAQPIHEDLLEIQKAAQRSADLTRHLLAFARKQVVSPVVLDLNDTISGMLKMLRRLIGEDIDLVWKPGPALWMIKIDPAQIDQIMANLLVNAKDAIAGVGDLTIETDNVVLDEAYCEGHDGFIPGRFVMMTVSDSGSGMDKDILAHIFEPFFTTKEVGQGTGLGLATIYGIVKQNNGFINVYSELGKGTSFKIYLPEIAETLETPKTNISQRQLNGSETILLAEDEATILKLGKSILQRYGYTVLAAQAPYEALSLAKSHQGPIHLLITDVIMPEMNGKDLRENLVLLYPEIKCLYMSGYTANAIAHHGVLDEGVNFLQKPFSVKTLAEKVRDTIEKK